MFLFVNVELNMSTIVTLKLITGEELVAALVNKTETGVVLNKPRLIAVVPDQRGGYGRVLMPWLQVEVDDIPEIKYEHIICLIEDKIPDDLESGYLQNTTEIALP